jgi:shikimate kinase
MSGTLPGCIALLGFRGAGKTTLGARLAERLRRPFFDLDREIELAQGRPIARLFAEEGEAAFRQIEAETLEGIVARPGIVLAPGGGIVDREDNRRLLKKRCACVFLDVAEEALLARLAGSNRPRLTALPFDEEVRSVLARRRPLYRECSDRILPIQSDEGVDATISRLIALVGAP